jgi:hypothetical protein
MRRTSSATRRPMLEPLKTAHAKQIVVPERRAWRPDREQLAIRFERFAAA